MLSKPFLLRACLVNAAALSLSGCMLGTAADIVAAPVRVAGAAIDFATTSQSEADEKRGRELRKREEKLAKLERRYARELENCREGNRRDCDRAQLTYLDIQQALKSIPPPSPENQAKF